MTTQKTVLITGFEPFGKETTNPSWEAAKQLQGRELCGAHIEAGHEHTLTAIHPKKTLAR